MADKLKDCSVVIVKLLDEILTSGTVRIYRLPPLAGSDEFCSDSVSSKTSEPLEKLQKCLGKIPLGCKRSNAAQRTISVYTEINGADVITNVTCTRFRKRKLEPPEQDESDVEAAVGNVITYLVDRAVGSVYSDRNINYASPGTQEAELVKEFCKENGFNSEDYRDLTSLFTFETVSLEDSPPPPPQKRTKKRKALRKILRRGSVDREEIMTPATRDEEVARTQKMSSALDGIENETIRKILEDFGRLSRSQDSLNSSEQKRTSAKTKAAKTSHGRNPGTTKPLNVSGIEKTSEKCTSRATKTDRSVEKSDPNRSNSILKSLLHSPEQNQSTAKDNETQTDDLGLVVNKSEKSCRNIIKKTISQQTDQEGDNYSLTGHCSNHKGRKNEENATTLLEIPPGGTAWINNPNAILEKIQKLRKDIVYLDLLAEEKEKERIAILCFKSYKESVLRKIFSNKETIVNSSHCSDGSDHTPPEPVTIPDLIHPLQNRKDPDASIALSLPTYNTNRILYPSFLQALHPQPYTHIKSFSEPEKKDDNIDLQFEKCCSCDLSMAGSQYTSCNNRWCCIASSQTRSWSRNSKEHQEMSCQRTTPITKSI